MSETFALEKGDTYCFVPAADHGSLICASHNEQSITEV